MPDERFPLINMSNFITNKVLTDECDSADTLKVHTQKTIYGIEKSNIDAFSSIQKTPTALIDDSKREHLMMLPLNGMCFAVKEVIDVDGYVCNLGCDAFSGRIPTQSAEIVQNLEKLGAQLIGITRSTELAIAKETSTVNPWSQNHTPGGSSSGSASAVGGGLVPFALGTQTIGSIIRPAAYCGAVGFKPSKGVGSLVGVLTLSNTLDHLGYFSDSLERLTTTLNLLYPELLINAKKEEKKPYRIICLQPWFAMEEDLQWQKNIHKVKKWAVSHGVDCIDMSLDAGITEQEENVTDSILCFEMSEQWDDLLFNNKDTSDFLQEFLQRGKSISLERYQACLAQQKKMKVSINHWLGDNDIIVFPSVTGLPPKLGDGTGSRDTQRLWTLLGMPALNLPIGIEGDFPNNIQLITKVGRDAFLLETAKIFRDSVFFPITKPLYDDYV